MSLRGWCTSLSLALTASAPLACTLDPYGTAPEPMPTGESSAPGSSGGPAPSSGSSGGGSGAPSPGSGGAGGAGAGAGAGGGSVGGIVGAPCVSGMPTIDGKLDEEHWGDPSYPIEKVTFGDTQGASATFQVRWNSLHLYIGARVVDGTPNNDSFDCICFDDGIEIYFDIEHDSSTSYGEDDFQYIVGWSDPALFEKNNKKSGEVFKTSDTADGYEMEIAIPWSTLGKAPGPDVFGFDIGVNLDHDGGTRDGQLMWHGDYDNWLDTSKFGAVKLLPCPS